MHSQKTILRFGFSFAMLIVIYSCIQPEPIEEADLNEWLSGGSQTVFEKGAGAFSSIFPNLSPTRQAVHDVGDAGVEATFVSAPAVIRPGLGPLFNNVSCTSCHVGDGRGKPPLAGEQISSLLFRLSIPGTDEHDGPRPVLGFGGQLQHRSIFGIKPEATVDIQYVEQPYMFADGTSYSLRNPAYVIQNAYTLLPSNVMVSPRIAPPFVGLGLLEAIPDADILALADEDDTNEDGISGRPNYVWDILKKKKVLGRFGWKANNTDLLQQSASAYSEDMGVTNFVFPRESSANQIQFDGRDDEYEVSDSILTSVAFYIRTLAVPARRSADEPIVLRGKQLFMDAKCGACHKPMQKTATNVAFPEISNQTIFPYTDLLLHDMGPALADNRPDYDATGREWRTSPLWGIGLTKVVNGHNNFLHDGRARTLLEAVLWHDGEAEQSKEYVRQLSKDDRDALVKFLESL